ncbi:hypothetical protein BKA82DRAFT_762403 [Pisolithus tinctorius]|uniref:Uncharacterized protein n=1 Tax=Pisolithus tinctorius Marx 270 TaxID=870435 RepID=A0A0C3NH84_PISTI|nr:hypothetical protein BKA82DRAFT_762403 [Pisolithus tinctorius]KIO00375.1 hypothetical protein M404DRAFT_762403 [Pisolithus tinctorius Marx 270]
MQNMFHLSHSRTSTFCLHTRAHGATITATRGEGQVFRTWWARVAALTAVAIGMVTVKCSFPLLVCPEPTLLSAFDLPFSAYARTTQNISGLVRRIPYQFIVSNQKSSRKWNVRSAHFIDMT